jgi:hypothetical protein
MLHTSPCREERRVDQEGKDGQQQQSGGLWAAGIFFVALVFLLIVLGGYVQHWEWTGLAVDTNYPKRKLWDWLKLLIVPVVLALGGYLFTRSENQRTQEVADKERTLDREIADERRQDDTLQAYLDQIGQLLLDKERPLRQSKKDDEVQTLARARTLTVLASLDGRRKGTVVQFLYESGLIDRGNRVVRLHGADLAGINPPKVIQRLDVVKTVSIQGTKVEVLRIVGANLQGAILEEVNLTEANLLYANLREANLKNASLNGANLSGARLAEANLLGANLAGVHFNKTNLSRGLPSGGRPKRGRPKRGRPERCQPDGCQPDGCRPE